MKPIRDEINWQGNTEEFASLCERWLKIKDIGKTGSSVTIRLVRDYVGRGILSKPEPRGKEVIFGYTQLIQFVACRHLLNEGFPLKKIAEDIQLTEIEVVRTWIPGETEDKSAMDLINEFKESPRAFETLSKRDQELAMYNELSKKIPSKAADEKEYSSDSYQERSRRRASYKIDDDPYYFNKYFELVKEFDENMSKVIKQDLTAIQLKSWLILFIDRLRLQKLTIEEAEEIGEAIKAALVNQAKLPKWDPMKTDN